MKTVKVKIRLSKVECAILKLQKCQNYQELSQHINQLIDRLIKSGSLKIIMTKLIPSEELNLIMKYYTQRASVSEDCHLGEVGTLFLKGDKVEKLRKYGIDISSTVIKKLLFIGCNYSLRACIKLSQRISITNEDDVVGDNAVSDNDDGTAEPDDTSNKQLHKHPEKPSERRTVKLPRQLADCYKKISISKVFREKLHSLSSVTIVNDVLSAKCAHNDDEDYASVEIMLTPNDISRSNDILAKKTAA